MTDETPPPPVKIASRTRGGGFMTWGQLLRFIDTYYKDTGLSPSYSEMRDAMHVNSTSTIAHHVAFLLTRGMLTKKEKSPRTLLLTQKGKEILAKEADG